MDALLVEKPGEQIALEHDVCVGAAPMGKMRCCNRDTA
jgi:hypothetical protein